DAEDAAQQVFLSAHRALLNGAHPREPAAWLATITRNECWARSRARMREPLPTDDLDDVAAPDDPVAAAIRRADLAALWRALRALPEQQRNALLLREFGGLRYDELAAALAVSEPAVESLLFRARARLRAQLRAAAAALTGMSWLEPVARLAAGGGTPALATKAVAVGLGAAAVTGGAAVVPTAVAPRHHRAPVPIVEHVQPLPAIEAPAAPRIVRTVHARPAAPVSAPPPRRVERRRARTEHRGRDGGSVAAATTTELHEGRDGERRENETTTQTTVVAATTIVPPLGLTTTTEDGGRDGGGRDGGGDGLDGGGSDGGGGGPGPG
ncbi:MAG TPA: sigma-70 family RNA polymerase sigma factor, partial [Gaiellaceae bacterium]